MGNISEKNFRENQNTQFMLNTFSSTIMPNHAQSCPIWGSVEKYCKAGQATNKNMARTLRMLFT
jgi:hypothetical protein